MRTPLAENSISVPATPALGGVLAANGRTGTAGHDAKRSFRTAPLYVAVGRIAPYGGSLGNDRSPRHSGNSIASAR